MKPRADGKPDVEAWLELVTKKQGIPLDAYRNEVVWPTCALEKLASGDVEVTDEDLQKGFEANFGPRVRCLAIVFNDERLAQRVFDMARKRNTAEYFGELATQYSVEPGSQAMHGEVPPIKKNGGQPSLEEEAFHLKPGELSGLVKVGDKFVLLRCEGHTKAADVKFAEVRDDIYKDLREKKLHLAMGACMERLQEAATIDNYLAGTSHSPAQRAVRPPARCRRSARCLGGRRQATQITSFLACRPTVAAAVRIMFSGEPRRAPIGGSSCPKQVTPDRWNKSTSIVGASRKATRRECGWTAASLPTSG